LAHRHELEYASRALNSIEINGSFYSLQRPSSYQRWYSETPADFIFSVKGGRFITHMKKLRDVETALANFFASGLLALREKLGPILWQLPPNLGWNEERLNNFFDLLPRNTRQAAKLSANHDDNLKARAWTKIDISRPLRYAIEVRHESFMTRSFFALLRRHNIAFVFADTPANGHTLKISLPILFTFGYMARKNCMSAATPIARSIGGLIGSIIGEKASNRVTRS